MAVTSVSSPPPQQQQNEAESPTPRSPLSEISIPVPEPQSHHMPESRLAVEPSSKLAASSSHVAAAAAPPPLTQWQQQQPSPSRPSDATLDVPSPHALTATATGASTTGWSPVSITASHPLAPVIRLSPQMEEDIKAAVLEAAFAQQQIKNRKKKKNSDEGAEPTTTTRWKRKRNKSVRRAPDGRRESPRTTHNWLIAKKVLRWVSLTICAMMVVGESVLAIFDGAYADTALGICLGFLLGIWDTVRLVRLRLKRDVEPVSVFHLLAEGTFTVAIIVAVACIVDQVRRFWARQFLIRGWVFSAGMLVLEGIHITLFARACVDKYLHRDAVDFRRYHGWELPWYEDPQPTEIVVKYVHVCPRCESEFSPNHNHNHHGGDEEKIKEKRSKKSEKQPQSVPAVVVT